MWPSQSFKVLWPSSISTIVISPYFFSFPFLSICRLWLPFQWFGELEFVCDLLVRTSPWGLEILLPETGYGTNHFAAPRRPGQSRPKAHFALWSDDSHPSHLSALICPISSPSFLTLCPPAPASPFSISPSCTPPSSVVGTCMIGLLLVFLPLLFP
jgi:hypothetical protein